MTLSAFYESNKLRRISVSCFYHWDLRRGGVEWLVVEVVVFIADVAVGGAVGGDVTLGDGEGKKM